LNKVFVTIKELVVLLEKEQMGQVDIVNPKTLGVHATTGGMERRVLV
jgi:hypothetical protein